jgi:uncharacterized protein YneF (UPF0154 family)
MRLIDKIMIYIAIIFFIIGLLVLVFFLKIEFAIGTFIIGGFLIIVDVIRNNIEKKGRLTKKEISASYRLNFNKINNDKIKDIITDLRKDMLIVPLLSRKDNTVSYSLNVNGKKHYISMFFSIKNKSNFLEIIENAGEREKTEKQISITGIHISYSNKKIGMNSIEFVDNMIAFIELCKKIENTLPTSSYRILEIIVWQYINPDTVFNLKFNRHLNNIFKKQYSHGIKLQSEDEECEFGKEYTTFRIPLKTSENVIPNIVDIIW